jgi:hypothetical protein
VCFSGLTQVGFFVFFNFIFQYLGWLRIEFYIYFFSNCLYIYIYIINWELSFIIYFDLFYIKLSQSCNLSCEFYKLTKINLNWFNISLSILTYKKNYHLYIYKRCDIIIVRIKVSKGIGFPLYLYPTVNFILFQIQWICPNDFECKLNQSG